MTMAIIFFRHNDVGVGVGLTLKLSNVRLSISNIHIFTTSLVMWYVIVPLSLPNKMTRRQNILHDEQDSCYSNIIYWFSQG